MRNRGTGSIYQPKWRDAKTGEVRVSPALWLKYHCRGTCGDPECSGVHREASGFTKTADRDQTRKAEDKLRARLSEVDKGRLIAPASEKTTFAHMVAMIEADYAAHERKSTERLAASLKHLREAFGTCRAANITTDRITAYFAARRAAKAAPATIRNELAALGRMFTLAVAAGKVAARPHIPSVEVRNTRTGFFEQEDFDAVFGHLPADLKPVAEFAYLTGWRKTEMLTLTWANVDFNAGEIRLEPGTTKNDEGRTFPFAVLPPLGDLLSRQREHTAAVEKATGRVIPYVFHRRGKPILDYYGAWRKACTAAGVPGRLLHDCRRTAVRRLERAGVSRTVARKLTGHKTETVYLRYDIASSADLRAGVAKVAALLAAAQQPAAQQHKVIALKARKQRRAG